MIFYYLLFIWFVYALSKDFKHTLLVYLPMRIAIHQGIILWPVNPTVMFDSVACFFIILNYFFIQKAKPAGVKFPFTFPLALFACSEFLSSFFASTSGNGMNFLQNIVVGILFLYIVWDNIHSSDDLKLVIKGYTIMFTLAIGLSLFEQVTHFNPIIALETALLPANAPLGLIWPSTQVRFGGLFRAQAFMSISITYGAYCLMFFLFYFFFTNKYPIYNFYNKNKNKIFTLGLALGAFLSGSKSSILALAIGFVPLLRVKWFFNIKIVLPLVIVLGLSLPMMTGMYDDIYSAMTAENTWDYQGGSSLAMREMQLNVSLIEFNKSPVIGNGTKYLAQAMDYYGAELLGAESIWFGLLIEKGVIGIIAFVVILIYPLFMRRLRYKKIYLSLALGWLAINTMTTIPGLGNTFYYTLIILLYKAQLLNENEKYDKVICNNTSI